MTVAKAIDAVIGADTHRDTHTLEMCGSTGADRHDNGVQLVCRVRRCDCVGR